MRKILLGLLTLMMFTPSLACAMSICPMPSEREGDVSVPCHGPEPEHNSGPMLVLDCLGIDLFSHHQDHEFKSPSDFSDLPYDNLSALQRSFLLLKPGFSIRGPPDERQIASSASQALYLITQRLRI
jgi:hypothetical protein